MLKAWWHYYTTHWTAYLLEMLGKQPDVKSAGHGFARKYKERVARAYLVGMLFLHLSIFSFWMVALPLSTVSGFLAICLILMAPILMVSSFFRRIGEQSIWSFIFCPLSIYIFDSAASELQENYFWKFTVLLIGSHIHNAIFARFLSYTPVSPITSKHIETSEFSYFSRSDAIFLVFFPTYGSLMYFCQTYETLAVLSLVVFATALSFPSLVSTELLRNMLVVLVPFKLFLHYLSYKGLLQNMVELKNEVGWLCLVLVPLLHNSIQVWKRASLLPAICLLPLLTVFLSS